MKLHFITVTGVFLRALPFIVLRIAVGALLDLLTALYVGSIDWPTVGPARLKFPTDTTEQSADLEAPEGRLTIDEIEIEPGSETSGTAEFKSSVEMSNDLEHDPDGRKVGWGISW